MGRELRRVTPNWEHPKETKYNSWKGIEETSYVPLFDTSFREAMEEWLANLELWKQGKMEYQEPEDGTDILSFAQNHGEPPTSAQHRPDWKPEEATWWQVYETVSEGTPVTPPFATREELVEYLVTNGDFWDQQRRAERDSGRNRGFPHMPCDPWTREQAQSFVFGSGYACSMVVMGDGQVLTGVQAGALMDKKEETNDAGN